MKTKLNILVVFVLLAALVGGTATPAHAQETHYISWSPNPPQEGGGWVDFTTTYPEYYFDLKWERSSNPGGTTCDQLMGYYDGRSEFWQSGDYLICLTIWRTFGDPEPIYDTQVMTVTNLPPEIDQMYVNPRGGLVYSVSASTFDQDWATLVTCTVDYGDGTGPQPAVGFGLMTCDGPDHEYAAEGTYTATMSLNEAGFAPVTSTITVNVVNVPVDHVFTWSPASPTVGEDVTFSLVYGVPPPEISFLWTRSSEPGGTVCDATIGTGVAPVISFAAAGAYKVCVAWFFLGQPQPMGSDSQVVTVTEAEEVPYQSAGFGAPIDLGNVLNTAKAGQMIPIKWLLLDGSGNPITNLDPASVTLTVSPYACPSGVVTDVIETYATGASNLQNLGNGYYQLNWKTDKTWTNMCKQITLKIGTWSGDGFTALFQFKK